MENTQRVGQQCAPSTNWIVQKSNTDAKGGREGLKRHKGAHQDRGALGGSGLRGTSGGNIIPVNVSNPLIVSVQDETTVLLAQSMSTENETSGNTNNAANSEPVIVF